MSFGGFGLSTGDEAVQMVPVLEPACVIMDVKMPGMNGIAAAQKIREKHPDMGIIMLSAYDDSDFIREFLKDDPKGKAYLPKHTLGTMEELIRTVHDVSAGRTVLDPIMVEKLTAQKGIGDNSPLKDLTRRELEVLSLMAKACTNGTIASILFSYSPGPWNTTSTASLASLGSLPRPVNTLGSRPSWHT